MNRSLFFVLPTVLLALPLMAWGGAPPEPEAWTFATAAVRHLAAGEKGQRIAQVGNTGNSGAPHLHFQVMDSADFRTANGLPVMFEDMPALAMLVEHPIRTNTLSFSDNVFSTVK
jgi:hypothetical protein